MRLQVQHLDLLSGLRIWHCCELWYIGCRFGLDPMLLRLQCGLAATILIWPLAWESPYIVGVALKKTTTTKTKQSKKDCRASPPCNKLDVSEIYLIAFIYCPFSFFLFFFFKGNYYSAICMLVSPNRTWDTYFRWLCKYKYWDPIPAFFGNLMTPLTPWYFRLSSVRNDLNLAFCITQSYRSFSAVLYLNKKSFLSGALQIVLNETCL